MPRGLLRFLARRLCFSIALVVLIASTTLTFAHLAPGDFTTELVAQGADRERIEQERARAGLDQPFWRQYLTWLTGVVRMDLGSSILYGRPVRELVAERAGNTALLAAAALLLATGVGLPLGVISGSHRRPWVSFAVRLLSTLCLSLPPLLTSLVLAWVAARTGWFPIAGMSSPVASQLGTMDRLLDLAWHMMLPTLALALPVGATIERLQAQAVSAALREPYAVAAIARGLGWSRVVWRHVARNALKPVASLYGVMVGALLSGSFAVEIVTAWPGLGQLTYQALVARDTQLAAGCAIFGSVFLSVGILLSDVALAVVDPRIREEG